MKQSIFEEFIDMYNIDVRITLFNVHEQPIDKKPHLSGMLQNESLKSQFLSFYGEHHGTFSESITILDNPDCTKKGIVRVSSAEIYKEATFLSPVVTQAGLGTIVTIVKQSHEWIYVQLPDGYLGWVNETVAIIDNSEIEKWNDTNLLIVTSLWDLVYESEVMDVVVSDVSIGNFLLCSETSDSFYKVTYPDNRTGYLQKSSASPLLPWKSSLQLTKEKIIETALKFVGIPYVWGGYSSRGLDCSGFTKMVYQLNGVQLPRDADQQVKCGVEIETDRNMSNVLPGDLLFFGRRIDGSVNKIEGKPIPITHVGLSLGGKKYIQASGDIHTSSFDRNDKLFDKRRAESLQMIRRVL